MLPGLERGAIRKHILWFVLLALAPGVTSAAGAQESRFTVMSSLGGKNVCIPHTHTHTHLVYS
jgi:hypothetical protein